MKDPSESSGSIPRGIEVLVKKASVDPEFRELLLDKRSESAAEIELELSAAEAAMLNAVPRAQIEQIIENITVPDEHRRAFLGMIGAAMLALVFSPLPTGAWEFRMTGHQPDLPKLLPKTPQRTLPFEQTWDAPAPVRLGQRRDTPVRMNPRDERLKVEVQDHGTNSVTVKVEYECPFENGEVRIWVGSDPNAPAVEMRCHPERALASRGRGDVTFCVEGKGGTTDGLLVQLLNETERHKMELPASLPVHQFQAGEYSVADWIIYRVAEFRKVWPS